MSPPLTIDDRIKIIDDLEVFDVVHSNDVAYAEGGKDSAAVAAGSSISFVGNLEGQMKRDVLNSTLLAQLAANFRYNRQTQTTQWYEFYKSILETLGWNVQKFEFARMSDVNSYFSVDNLLLKLAAAYLTGGELELFKTMINSLKDTKNAMATKIFDSSAKDFKKANFQCGVASNAQGNAMFKIGTYYYGAQQNIDKVLFFTFGSQTIEFYGGSQIMLLNEDVYSQVRSKVLKKLGTHAIDLVDDIKI